MPATLYHGIVYSKMSLFQRAQVFNDNFSPSTSVDEYPLAAKFFLEGFEINESNCSEMTEKIKKLASMSPELKDFYKVVTEHIVKIASVETMSTSGASETDLAYARPTPAQRKSVKTGRVTRKSYKARGVSKVPLTSARIVRATKMARRVQQSTSLRNPVSKVFEPAFADWAAEQTRKANAGEPVYDEDTDAEEEEVEKPQTEFTATLSHRPAVDLPSST